MALSGRRWRQRRARPDQQAIIDAPVGGGKIPLQPVYVHEITEKEIIAEAKGSDVISRRVMKPALGFVVALATSACAPSLGGSSRDEIIRHIVPSTVQLRCEREGGVRRAASGVVLAVNAETRRSWILTTRHFLEPVTKQEIHVIIPGRKGRVKTRLIAVSEDADLALLVADGVTLVPVTLKESAKLGDDVWIVAFPWGRRLTVVGGVVSQISAEAGEAPVEGPARMVDASVSYGASGGGVFDAVSGALIGVVESHRTARVTTPGPPEHVIEIPVPGETTLVSTELIRRFMDQAGLAQLLRR